MGSVDIDKLTQYLRDRINEVEDLKKTKSWSPEFDIWNEKLRRFLQQRIGSEAYEQYNAIFSSPAFAHTGMTEADFHEDYCKDLDQAKAVLIAIEDDLKNFGLEKTSPLKVTTEKEGGFDFKIFKGKGKKTSHRE